MSKKWKQPLLSERRKFLARVEGCIRVKKKTQQQQKNNRNFGGKILCAGCCKKMLLVLVDLKQ